jgi:hypothetical protein
MRDMCMMQRYSVGGMGYNLENNELRAEKLRAKKCSREDRSHR